MSRASLSRAFSTRDAADVDFLRSIDGTTGFRLFWIDVVRPLLVYIGARHVVEIGADQGDETRELRDYCAAWDGHLTVIEPKVTDALRTVIAGAPCVRLCEERGETALARLACGIDAVLLEGDLNYATVHADLVAIGRIAKRTCTPFPLVFVKGTSWPYGRRDMYYAPAALASQIAGRIGAQA